jgi:plasmid stabilization system protein ParE
MPIIRKSADLRNSYSEISAFCHKYREPNFITKNGEGDLAVMSVDYIRNTLQNPIAANNLKDVVKKTYKNIKGNPFLYPTVPNDYLFSLGYRFAIVNNYIIFYYVTEKTINITRFLYGHRDWINILDKKL